MPGAYAHLTLVNLAREPARLENRGLFSEAIVPVLDYFRYCELGAVSPDYPYLNVFDRNASSWADRMHYERSGDMIKTGVSLIRKLKGARQRKAFSWLLGYASHVVTDTTVHPVVELKVGEYTKNKDRHRVCEMHQDAYIFQRMNLGEIGLAEHLDSGIWGCCDPPGSGKLDPEILEIWQEALEICYPVPCRSHPPVINSWHRAFKNIVDLAEEGNRLPPFARHVASNIGLTYPSVANIDAQYILRLPTPDGSMSYDQVFDKALDNVLGVWLCIAQAVFQKDSRYQTAIGNWNLDTGRNGDGTYAFWSGQA